RAALSAGLRTSANEKSFNNETGLPVTILNSPDDTEALVLEMGMRGFGEIARLCAIGQPTIGLVTRVAAAHTELLGGIDGVARAKSELVAALPANGLAVLNADDHHVLAMKSLASCRVLTFGRSAAADVRIDNLILDDLARPRFDLRTPWGTAAVQLAVSGEHMAANAAGAIAIAASCGVNLDAAVAAVGHAQLSPWRMEITRSASGAIVINDAYNANPESMRAAIETLASLQVSGRRVAVLGVMAELADPAGDHAAIAQLLQQRNIELIAVGTDNYGVPARGDAQAVISSLAGNDAVLIKGSRVAGLERLAALVV
ncbi:MAG: UDP-N-acetylmuramoylalanyl-D-glutamyl-2, 6-diaminopimelate--D-alanyl-D-alanine ligase, partial [Actinobacteria bacterium]|nr:UDP-N-acetylmuramoylalanyl-D-glutamyl-2, 6-diaminopimelate--D-alanyl-D-alanine ligase [Actinomycetota bacterium]